MNPAAIIAFVAALAASGSAAAQGVGLRVGDAGGWIAPTLGARIGDSPLDYGAGSLPPEGRARPSRLSGFLDWRPAGQLRLTAGLVARNDRADIGGLGAAQHAHDHRRAIDVGERLVGQPGRGESRGNHDEGIERMGHRRRRSNGKFRPV